jgi:hypothetical protein
VCTDRASLLHLSPLKAFASHIGFGGGSWALFLGLEFSASCLMKTKRGVLPDGGGMTLSKVVVNRFELTIKKDARRCTDTRASTIFLSLLVISPWVMKIAHVCTVFTRRVVRQNTSL